MAHFIIELRHCVLLMTELNQCILSNNVSIKLNKYSVSSHRCVIGSQCSILPLTLSQCNANIFLKKIEFLNPRGGWL